MSIDEATKTELNTHMTKMAIGKFRRFAYWLRSHKFYSLFISIVLLIAGFFVYERIALELNKRAFSQARSAIDTVYADIVKQVGAPDNVQSINECSRSHLELSDGPLSCYVDTAFIFGVANKPEADQLTTKIKLAVAANAKILEPVAPPKSEIPITPSVHDVSDSELDYYSAAGIFCGIKYVYDMPREISLEIKNTSKKPFFVTISCSSDARDTYYPLAN